MKFRPHWRRQSRHFACDGAEKEGTLVLPVIISPSRYEREERLLQFQAVNNLREPLIDLSPGKQEAVFNRVAEQVERAVGGRELRAELRAVQEQLHG